MDGTKVSCVFIAGCLIQLEFYILSQVVDNDGVHAKLEKCSDVKLAAGEHQVKVMMFQAAKDVVLSATYR